MPAAFTKQLKMLLNCFKFKFFTLYFIQHVHSKSTVPCLHYACSHLHCRVRVTTLSYQLRFILELRLLCSCMPHIDLKQQRKYILNSGSSLKYFAIDHMQVSAMKRIKCNECIGNSSYYPKICIEYFCKNPLKSKH